MFRAFSGDLTIFILSIQDNKIRESKGIPLLPKEWKCKEASSKDYIICYPTNENDRFHAGKKIWFKLLSKIKERDTYYHEDEELGRQKISITHFYNIDSIEVEYIVHLGTIAPKWKELSIDEAQRKLMKWKNSHDGRRVPNHKNK